MDTILYGIIIQGIGVILEFLLHMNRSLIFVTALYSQQDVELIYVWICNVTIPLKLTWNCNIAWNPTQ